MIRCTKYNSVFIGHSEPDFVASEGILDEALWLSKVIVEEVPVVLVTLGKHGVMLCQNTHHEKLPVQGYRIEVIINSKNCHGKILDCSFGYNNH
jgi:formate dehydrogenase assembly factor FdhD